MSSGYMTTLNSHGIREGSKADRPDEAKVKAERKEKEKAEEEAARVDVLTATYEEQEHKRRTRRGGQNQRDEVARQNREGTKRFPVLVGGLGALRSGVQRRPAPVPREVGLQDSEASWKPLAKGTSLFMHGYSEKTEIPSQPECSEKIEVSGEQKSAFSFHTTQPVQACENGLAFHTENSAPPTVCIPGRGCTRAMGSRKAVEAFCRYVDTSQQWSLV